MLKVFVVGKLIYVYDSSRVPRSLVMLEELGTGTFQTKSLRQGNA